MWFFITVALYIIADFLFYKTGKKAWAHPVLLPSVVLIVAFKIMPIEISAYMQQTRVLSELLIAAIVALAMPLYQNWSVIKDNAQAVFAAIIGGSIAGAGSAVFLTVIISGDASLVATFALKSVTTPIAYAVAPSIGGTAPLAAATVILTGLFVAIVGPWFLAVIGVSDEATKGIAMGVAGHGLGMAEAVRRSDVMGAAAAFSMAVNGTLTAFVLPFLWSIF